MTSPQSSLATTPRIFIPTYLPDITAATSQRASLGTAQFTKPSTIRQLRPPGMLEHTSLPTNS
jgi:hypothetical protein